MAWIRTFVAWLAYQTVNCEGQKGNLHKVASPADLECAVEVRYVAYQRHAAPFAETLRAPEPLDHAPGTVVLLAEDKRDRAALGTMRIQTNAFEPLVLEQSIALPDALRVRTLAEATRLGVVHGRIGALVKNALFKVADDPFGNVPAAERTRAHILRAVEQLERPTRGDA